MCIKEYRCSGRPEVLVGAVIGIVVVHARIVEKYVAAQAHEIYGVGYTGIGIDQRQMVISAVLIHGAQVFSHIASCEREIVGIADHVLVVVLQMRQGK